MLAAGIQTPEPLEELEIHLRDEIERQMKSGLDEQNAFEVSAQKIGEARSVKIEFKKIDTENWSRPLAWTAWALFAVSFFIPTYADWLGWQCAGISAMVVSWPDFWQRNWFNPLHLASMTLANLLMIASPFLLPRFSQNKRLLKWLRFASFAALILVWSFVLLLLTHADGPDLKVGCYVWSTSFLLLCLSTLRIRSCKNVITKYV
jgi:hypothetical protein